MTTSWRRLTFFTQQSAPAPELLLNSTTSCALADGGLAVADSSGVCRLLRPDDLSVRATFTAHASGVTHLAQPPADHVAALGHGLIITIGLEPDGGADRAYLRVWRDDGSEEEITCARAPDI